MSAIAGQRSAIMGAYYSEAQHGGQGTLVTGVHVSIFQEVHMSSSVVA